jgi:hypothetical protein
MNAAGCIAVTGRAIGYGLRINGEIFAEKRLFNTVAVHGPSLAEAALSIALMILLEVGGGAGRYCRFAQRNATEIIPSRLCKDGSRYSSHKRDDVICV